MAARGEGRGRKAGPRSAFLEGGCFLRSQDGCDHVDATRIVRWRLIKPAQPEGDDPFGGGGATPLPLTEIAGYFNQKEHIVFAAYPDPEQARDVFNDLCVTISIGRPYDFKEWPEPVSNTGTLFEEATDAKR